MRVIFTARAENDLLEIKTYIASDNSARAASFRRELAQACIAIGDLPLGCPTLIGTRFVGLRRKNFHPYAIIYKATGTIVEIIRILHGARDIPRVLRTGTP